MPMTQRDYYLEGRNNRLMEVYRRFAIKVAVSYGADESQAQRDFEELIDFEIDLANVSMLGVNKLTIKYLIVKFRLLPHH